VPHASPPSRARLALFTRIIASRRHAARAFDEVLHHIRVGRSETISRKGANPAGVALAGRMSAGCLLACANHAQMYPASTRNARKGQNAPSESSTNSCPPLRLGPRSCEMRAEEPFETIVPRESAATAQPKNSTASTLEQHGVVA